MVCDTVESRIGKRHVRLTSVRISCVHERALQLGGTKLLSTTAVSTTHGSPPMVTMFSLAVVEKAWPLIVIVSPSLAVSGDVCVSTGVKLRAYAKVHPLGISQTADSSPAMVTKVGRVSTTGGGAAGYGDLGGGGSLGGDGSGGGKWGGGRKGGGGLGGGDGARRMPQSAQSVPIPHALNSEPGPPSSQTPSLTHPSPEGPQSFWQTSGGNGGGGGLGGGLLGNGGGCGGMGGEGGKDGVGGGARGATTSLQL